MDFYAKLKEAMIANVAYPVPQDMAAIIDDINKNQELGREKESLVAVTYVLGATYKSKVSMARTKNLRKQTKDARENKSVKVMGKRTESVNKVNRSECVPDECLESNNQQIKTALALFLSARLSDAIRHGFVTAILNNPTTSAEHIVDIFEKSGESANNVREYIKSKPTMPGLDAPTTKYVICALIELSELLGDKSYCKLAMDIDAVKYGKFVQIYLDKKVIHSIVPFEPAIASYLKSSIAACEQANERQTISNQFKIQPVDTMRIIIKGLSQLATTNKSIVFKPEEIYQCFKGQVGYTRDINFAHYPNGNTDWKVLTYSDCLYDVIGRTIDTVDVNGLVTRTNELFDNLCWSDRLKLIPEFRTKVDILPISGKDLNEYSGESSDITVSWFNDDGYSCTKTYLMKKPKDIKIKTEIE